MEGTVLEAVLDVFSAVGVWFSEFVPTLFTLFWTPATSTEPGQLTFLGVLSVAALSIGVVLLVMSIIQGFLRFR